jgi:hypothetical protein
MLDETSGFPFVCGRPARTHHHDLIPNLPLGAKRVPGVLERSRIGNCQAISTQSNALGVVRTEERSSALPLIRPSRCAARAVRFSHSACTDAIGLDKRRRDLARGDGFLDSSRLRRSNLTFAPLGRPERFSESRVNRVDDALDAAVAAHAGAPIPHARPDMLENRLPCC